MTAAICLLVVLLAYDVAGQTNLMENNGFEMGLDNWFCVRCTMELYDEDKVSGNFSLRVTER